MRNRTRQRGEEGREENTDEKFWDFDAQRRRALEFWDIGAKKGGKAGNTDSRRVKQRAPLVSERTRNEEHLNMLEFLFSMQD